MESGRAACLISRPVISSDSFAKGIALSTALLGGLNGLDAAPFFTALGYYLAHLLTWVVSGAVVAVNGFSRGHGCAG
jgi:hypothetical protein